MIVERFRGRNILITGVTGFLGKIILEKILRSLPDVGQIYLLIRPKKDTDPLARLQGLVRSRVFNRLRSERPDFEEWALKKLTLLAGDVSRDQLGMSSKDIAMVQENVNIFIHSAATVNFTERLPDAISLNVLGSLRLFEMAQNARRCECFAHISTAYVNCNKRGTIEETLYPLDFDPQSTLRELLAMDPDQMEANEEQLILGYPNTYAFTKALTEHLLVERRGSIPLLLFRPTIIGACYKEPTPGWLDTVSAASALYVTTGMGIMKFMLAHRPTRIGDQVPADIVTNSFLCATADVATENRFNVVQVGTSKNKPLTWQKVKKTILPYLLRRPPKRTFSKPTFMFITSDNVYNSLYFFQYRVPIAAYSLYARFLGTEKQLKEAQLWGSFEKRVRKMVGNFSYFVNNEWIFDTTHMYEVWDKMTAEEQMEFPFDIEQMDWEEYLLAFCYGMKLNILRETDTIYPPEDRNCPVYLRRDLGADFSWAFLGGRGVNDIYKINRPEDLIPQILDSLTIREAIAMEAENEGMALSDVEHRAKEILDVMAGSMNLGLLRTEGYFFRKFYRYMYQGIFVDEMGIRRVAEAAKRGPIVVIPTHRSYVDFLLTSFVFYDHDLPIPRIASGDDFLNMAIVSWVFRNSGAFFMRRSNGKDELYRRIFNEYVKGVISAGHPLEFFIEGTRSRTGKSMPPKLGLLSNIVRASLDEDFDLGDVSICPMTISYERVIEEASHAHELAGQPKEKPTTTALVKASLSKLIYQNYGRINVQFAPPISIAQFAEEHRAQTQGEFDPVENPDDLWSLSKSLGHSVIESFHQEIVMMPTQLLAAVILVYRGGISRDLLAFKFGWLRDQLVKRGQRVDPIEGSNEEIVMHCKPLMAGLFMDKRNIIQLEVVQGQKNIHVMQLCMYRNGILHSLQREGLVALTLNSFGPDIMHGEGVRKDHFLQAHEFLSDLFADEFVDRHRHRAVEQTLAQMEELGLISIEKRNYEFIQVLPPRSRNDDMFHFLCELFWPFIESFWLSGVIVMSLQDQPLGAMERLLVERTQWFGEKCYYERVSPYFDATAKESIRFALKFFTKLGILHVDDSNTMTLSDDVQSNPAVLNGLVDRIGSYRNPAASASLPGFARL